MLRRIENIYLLFFLFLFLVGLDACSKDFSDNPKANQPPKTFVSIFTDNDLHAGTSRQTINWWGDDPDGMVDGFIYTFDENAPNLTTWNNQAPDPAWTFTTETQQTFGLRLSGTDTVYTFWVKAVDDEGTADPDGAIQKFPIINTRPTLEFPAGTDVPETTFTVAAFVWSGTDLDGNDTIDRFEYVLDDTTHEEAWTALPPNTTILPLTAENGLMEGEHIFYLRAVDIAGAVSDVIRMPRDANDIWYVKEPKSDFLLVDDYNVADGTDSFYKSTLEAIVGPVDVWDIKSRSKALEPPTSLAFTLTLQLFDRIFWYADTGPNLEKAQVSVPAFLEQGGKLIMSTSFQEFASNQGDPLDFSPVDSLGAKINRIIRNQLVQQTESFAAMGFPELQVSATIIPNVFPLVPKISSKVMYMLPENPDSWPGSPTIGVIDQNSTFVFFGLPLASLNGQANVPQLLEKILNEIF